MLNSFSSSIIISLFSFILFILSFEFKIIDSDFFLLLLKVISVLVSLFFVSGITLLDWLSINIESGLLTIKLFDSFKSITSNNHY